MSRLALVLAAALLVDAVRLNGLETASGAAVTLVGASYVIATGGRSSRGSTLLVGIAVVLGCFLAVRAAPWLTVINASGAATALAAAAILKRRGSVFDLDPSRFVDLTGRAVEAALVAGIRGFEHGYARVAARAPSMAGAAVVRGILISVPLAGFLLLLLASSDVVFAHLLHFEMPSDDLDGHLVALGGGAFFALLLAAIGAHAPGSVERRRRPARRRSEAVMVLVATDVILAAFVLTQIVTALGGADAAIRSSHLTYAEYARSGFFQLATVAAIMLLVVGVIRGKARPTPVLTVLSVTAIWLTLAIVAVAAQRMRLYQDAYGLTVLRLVVQWGIVWIAIALGLIGVALCRPRDRRRWLTGSLGASAALLLIALNVTNPEAAVARVNIERAHRGVAIDVAYLAGLSADAAQTLAREPLTSAIVVGRWSRPTGILDWNLARATAPR